MVVSFLLGEVIKNRLARDVTEGLWIPFTVKLQAPLAGQLERL